jgi:peptidoglycan/LPS O-acetylase OafA/YrhL
MSFSLYLIHFPIVALVGGTQCGSGKLAPDANGLMLYGLWLILILGIGAAFWWLFERNTESVRRLLTSTLTVTRPGALSP